MKSEETARRNKRIEIITIKFDGNVFMISTFKDLSRDFPFQFSIKFTEKGIRRLYSLLLRFEVIVMFYF